MAGHRILIIEDDPSMRKVLHAQLRAAGYEALSAGDAIVAFTEMRKNPPDLIILDLGLPGGGGLNLLQRMQTIPKLSPIPVVVLSAQPSTNVETEVMHSGAAAFFHKPTPPEVLLEKIRELLG